MYRSLTEYTDSLAVSAGLSVSAAISGGVFSTSDEARNAEKFFRQEDAIASLTEEVIALYTVALAPAAQLPLSADWNDTLSYLESLNGYNYNEYADVLEDIGKLRRALVFLSNLVSLCLSPVHDFLPQASITSIRSSQSQCCDHTILCSVDFFYFFVSVLNTSAVHICLSPLLVLSLSLQT